MPELPEVETVRRGLASRVAGRTVDSVWVGRERVVRRTSREELIAGLTGVKIEGADRRGKYLLLPLDSGEQVMIHLRMSGQVLLVDGEEPIADHTHVVATFTGGDQLRFIDPRTFGEVVVFDPERVGEVLPALVRLGPDPIAEDFPRAVLREIVMGTSRALKPLLLDQHRIAGIGNIYADEILHAARLRPDRAADSLDSRAVTRLHRSILDILTRAVEAGGSTLPDTQYVDLLGEGGWFQFEHRVYGRTGERCTTCGRGWIRRITSGGRSTHFCPVCQH